MTDLSKILVLKAAAVYLCESVVTATIVLLVQTCNDSNNGLRVQSLGANLTWVMSTVLIRKYYL